MTKKRAQVDPERWVDEFGDYLYKYALMRLKDPASASDAVQETFLAGIKGLKKYDGRVDIKYWLRGILRNKVVDHIRKAVREVPMGEDADTEGLLDSLIFKMSGVPSTNPDPWKFNPRKAFEKTEFWGVFHGCLGKLRGNMQRAFTMKMLEGMPTDEVCEILGVTRNSLWVIMHRARQNLKQCLETHWVTD